jgi:hypothetical protein
METVSKVLRQRCTFALSCTEDNCQLAVTAMQALRQFLPARRLLCIQ